MGWLMMGGGSGWVDDGEVVVGGLMMGGGSGWVDDGRW